MNFQAVWLSIAKCSELMQLISANAPSHQNQLKCDCQLISLSFSETFRTFKVQLCFWCVPISDLFKSLFGFLFEVSNRGFYFKTRSRICREENLFKRHYNQMSQPDNLDGHFCGSNLFPSNSKFEVRYFHYLATSRWLSELSAHVPGLPYLIL